MQTSMFNCGKAWLACRRMEGSRVSTASCGEPMRSVPCRRSWKTRKTSSLSASTWLAYLSIFCPSSVRTRLRPCFSNRAVPSVASS
ncbi:Uncharacterised protein [Bordetella pertussis]|nr:Uncharacterised protein [Bordetella pertussis]